MKEGMLFGRKERRPFIASEVKDLSEAEGWRRDLIREVSRKVTEIQNPGLGEHKIRDLNDNINKLLREKWHWEKQIKHLGGVDYRGGSARIGEGGLEVPGSRGYKYFGAAKDLPGVRELFQDTAPASNRRTREAIYRNIDLDYFGFRDEDDGTLVEAEASAEKKARTDAISEWDEAEAERKRLLEEVAGVGSGVGAGAGATSTRVTAGVAPDDDDDDDEAAVAAVAGIGATATPEDEAKAAIATQASLEKLLLERKRAALLSAYASDGLQQKQTEAKKLLNISKA